MGGTDITVTGVSSRGEDAIFTFSDGHKAIFEAYSHGFGYQIEGLRRFSLFNGDVEVVVYNSRLYHAGPVKGEHEFVRVDAGYTLERIADYWSLARNHVNEEYYHKPNKQGREGDPQLWFPWRVTSEGWMDLERIQEKKVSLPAST